MPIEKLRPTFSFDEERIKQLKQIAPEAFADNQVNFEILREALADYLEDDEQDIEHFGLFWPGKREARRMASIPSKGTLIPCPGEGIDEENTRNIFIEGENLEVLKILQKSYAGRIKMIYIDPPYNTGNDFVYDDDFTEPLEEYLRRTGQIDEEGKPLTTNRKSDGRFHSKWLSMMYPRLRIARNLLRDDGIIFISIDDNEDKNLFHLLNEIFGEENFITKLVWQKRKGGGNDSTFIASDHEYIFIFAKNKYDHSKWRVPYEQEYLKRYKEKDQNGKFYWDTLSRNGLQSPIIYDVKCPDGSIIKNGKWQCSEKTFLKKSKDGDIRITKNDDGKWMIHYKVRQPEGKVFRSIISNVVNGDAATEIEDLFGEKKIFDNPKPTELIKQLLELNLEEDDIILDFFAGSNTTAESVLKLSNSNKQDYFFITVQMLEDISDKSDAGKTAISLGYKNIFNLSLDRIKKAIIKRKYFGGFRLFKLKNSNFKIWKDYQGDNIEQISNLFESISSILVEGYNRDYLLYEIILLEGFPLDSKIEVIKDFKKNEVQQIASDFCEHKLLICLDKKVHSDTINNLQLGDNNIFICLDNAINDEEKVTLSDKGLIKTI